MVIVLAGPYQSRDIFESLDLAWSLFRSFPKELLKKIPKKHLDMYYARRTQMKEDFNKDEVRLLVCSRAIRRSQLNHV